MSSSPNGQGPQQPSAGPDGRHRAPIRAAQIQQVSPFITALTSRVTAQQLDPLSGITARIFVFVVGLVSVATAVCLGLSNGSQIGTPALQVAAIAALIVAYTFFVNSAEPYRKRIGGRTYLLVFALVCVAAVLDALSQLGSDTLVRDDWGPLCIALILMLAGPYRPPLEIVAYTVIALVVISLSTVIQESTLIEHTTFISLSVAGTPALALGIGSALYAGYLIAGLTADRAAAAEARQTRDHADRRVAIEEFLGRDVQALRADVLPFFRDLKARDALTPADIDRAAELQSRLRASIVANLSSDPLEDLVGTLLDPQHLARTLTERQRTAVRAYLSFLADQPTISRKSITLSFTSSELGLRGSIACPVDSDRAIASRAAPFIGLLQLAFHSVTDDIGPNRITVTFDF